MRIHTIQLNIQDFLSGTVHMDVSELGAYTCLLVALYNTKDNKLPNDDKRLSRICKCTPRKWASVKDVVLEKFVCKSDFIEHVRVQKEVRQYETLCTKNKANALKNKETGKPVASQSVCQTQANTNNKQQIINNKQKVINKYNIRGELWNDFISHRKEKKAPVTDRAVQGIQREAQKANWTLEDAIEEMLIRGWTGFKSDWVEKKKPKAINGMDTEL